MTELLAPAGSREALVAAVQNGANAVYLGVDEFNARRGARNFSLEELPAVVAYCHLRDVRVYLTLNTLVTDRELRSLSSVAKRACECGVDAVLVQDWGVLDTLRRVTPELPLHASTQMTVHNLSGAEEAAKRGLSRVVLARELCREDIRELCEKSPVEVEVFAHGALCMCWSGQCAMSAVIGQRSGNRGLCAQPCRLPYNGGYPLSLHDLCLADYVPELMDMGVACLKLEGRMKRPEYVAAVTGIYARLIKEHRGPTEEERTRLAEAFSRDGFTDGYYTGRTGRSMFGVRPKNARWPEEWFASLREDYESGTLRLVPIDVEARVVKDQHMTLTARDSQGREVSVTGALPEPARTRSVTAAELETRLRKTGGTAFRVEHCDVHVEDGLAVSAASVNALRREAVAAMEAARTAVPPRPVNAYVPPESAENPADPPLLTVSLMHVRQFSAELAALRPALICLPIDELAALDLSPYLEYTRFCAVLPRVYRTGEEARLREQLAEAQRRGVTAVGIGNLGHFALTSDFNLEKRGELSLNVFNSSALRFLKQCGLSTAAVSFELRHEQIRDLQKCLPCEAVIYGRLPLMITENRIQTDPEGMLTDRRGERFPVLETAGGRSEVENAKVLYLADHDDWQSLGLRYARLRFTTESAEDCVRVLRDHQEGGGHAPEALTRGLYYRGVE